MSTENGNHTDFIQDDTDIGLLERTNFQSIDTVDPDKVDSFVDEVEAIDRDKVHLARNPWVRIGAGLTLAFFALGFGLMSSLNNRKSQVAEVEKTEEPTLTLGLDEQQDSGTISTDASEMDRLKI